MTLTDRVAELFRQRPGEWVDAHELLKVGGFAGWRTRTAELRRPPYSMHIENRTRRIITPDGQHLTQSFYRYYAPKDMLESARG